MYNLSIFSGNMGLTGKIGVVFHKLNELFTELLHSPETGVVLLTNNEATAMPFGSMVSVDSAAQDSMINSSSLTSSEAECFGIVIGDDIAAGAKGYIRFEGEAWVRISYKQVVAPANGDLVFPSDTEGLGYSIAPASVLNSAKCLAHVVDASHFADVQSQYNGMVKVLIDNHYFGALVA